jgi:photosystem II stability/assembly factor-like uncharacterized protein
MGILTQKDASIWVQFRLGDKEYYLGDCTDLDAIPNPRLGGVDYVFCWNGKRDGFKKVGKKYSPPGSIEVTLKQLLDETISWLDKIKCPVTLYALKRTCGDAGVFKNWERGAILYDAELTGDELGAYASHVDDNESTHAYTMVAPPPRIDVWKLAAAQQTSNATVDINTIAACMNLYCDDDCGEYTVPGDNMIFGTDGSGGAKAKIFGSDDAGVTWVNSANQPWVTTENIMASACFEISKGVNRWLVVRGSTAAKPLQVAYSDDGGTTWTLVTIGATNTEGALGAEALFYIDWQHLWIATSEGNIYFSDDGGVTWTLQASGVSGTDLFAIHGADADVLVAVGASDTVIFTLDGGAHWNAASATGSGDDLLSVWAFDAHRWLIGTDGAAAATSSLFITFDGGDTYAERSFVGKDTEMVSGMSFASPGVGLIITNSMSSFASGGSVHQTIDGGYTFEEIPVPDNSGFNDVVMVSPTIAYVVGNAHSGAGVVLSIGKA